MYRRGYYARDLNSGAPIRFVQFVPRFFPRCPLYSFIISMFKAGKISKANDILSSSVKRENRLKLCQATWTRIVTAKNSTKCWKTLRILPDFYCCFRQKVAGSLVKLSEFTFKVFILCFQSYLCSFCTISSGLRVQFRHLLANLEKIWFTWCKHWCITSWPRIELDRVYQ